MKINISEKLVKRLQGMVDCGSYESVDHALEAAVHLLEEYEKEHEFELTIVRGMVRQAAEDGKKGNYRVYTDENLHELFEEIKREGRLRAFVQEGIDALMNGDYVEYTDENLHELVEDVHQRGLERLRARDESN